MFRIEQALERNQAVDDRRAAQTVAGSKNVKRFEVVALPHLDAAYNLARWLTGNDDDAQSLTQKSVLRAFHLSIQLPHGDARAWLLGIVHDTYFTWLNEMNGPAHAEPYRGEHNDRADNEPAFSGSLPAFRTDRSEVRQMSKELVNQAINELPVTLREIVVLRELEDLSYRQIAQIADIPVDDVMAHLARGRKLLQAKLFRLGAQSSK